MQAISLRTNKKWAPTPFSQPGAVNFDTVDFEANKPFIFFTPQVYLGKKGNIHKYVHPPQNWKMELKICQKS